MKDTFTPPDNWKTYTKSNPYEMPYTAIEEDFKPIEYNPFATGINPVAEEIKDIVYNELTETEKRVFLLYAYYGNAIRVSKMVNTSTGKFYNELRRIKRKIKHLYHERIDDSKYHGDNCGHVGFHTDNETDNNDIDRKTLQVETY